MSNIFDKMLNNYQIVSQNYQNEHKSAHWNQFVDYENCITNQDAWPNFLRNSLSAGFNDDFASMLEDYNISSIRASGADLKPILPKTIEDEHTIDYLSNLLRVMLHYTDPNFVASALMDSKVGSPAMFEMAIKTSQIEHPDNKPIPLDLNPHDMGSLYYFWQVYRAAKKLDKEHLVFADIGGGYGGVAAKMKKFFPDSTIILFDLPETNAVQTYYLSECFPNARIGLFEDYAKEGFSTDYDFWILPGWCLQAFNGQTIDMFCNMRSMMEMNLETVEFYIKQIEWVIKPGGLFYCANRYAKQVGDEINKIKEYPFDANWNIKLSQSAVIQNHIHELLIQRDNGNDFDLGFSLESLTG